MERNFKTLISRMISNRWQFPLIIFALSLVVTIGFYWYSSSWITALISGVISAILFVAYSIIREKLKKYGRIKTMEDVFPDFIQLMSSNLRAGMTIDRAILLSSRKEFSPLDEEILKLGKDLVTGKEIDTAMLAMSRRIGSEKITKTIGLIISGIRSGGNLSVLLEQTSSNMRERNFVEKRAASNVLMYMIFIFFAVAIGAPVLFSLSAALVQILTSLFANIPTGESSSKIPLTLTQVNISVEFVTYFAIVFLLTTNTLAALVMGLVNKGQEKDGVKYILPLCALGLACFFIVRYFLTSYFTGFFG